MKHDEVPFNPPGRDAYIAAGARKNSELVRRHELTVAAVQAGYGGVLNGRVVDRREHPEALPIPANPHLNVPEPKPCFLQKVTK